MERMFSRADLRKLLVPLMVEQALAMTIGMADTVMVASCSEAAVSGVSLIDSVNAVFLWLFPALATGGGVVLAQYIGRGEEENARRSVGQLTLLLVGFSLMISVLFMLFRDELLVLLFGQIEPQVMAYARTYFTVSIISYPFLALYNVGASVFRAVGNSKLSMTVSTAANALNLIGNAILIYGFGLEVLGAGLATLASRILGAVIMLYKLLRPDCRVGMRSFGDLRFQKEMFGRILRIGIPSGLESAAFNIGKLLVASLVSTLVTAAITANAVMNTLQSIILIPTSAIHLAAVPIVGQCLGAGKAADAKYYNNWLEMGEKLGDKAPKIFHVNWFRTDDEGNFLWPGFGDNMRVLLWILARCEGKVSARETEIGYLPYVKDIDIEGLENDGKEFTHMMLDELLSVDKALWREDAENIEGFYTSIGERLPAKLWEELETLKKNLE